MIKSPFKLPAMVWKFELCDARIYAPCENRPRGFLLLSVRKKKKKKKHSLRRLTESELSILGRSAFQGLGWIERTENVFPKESPLCAIASGDFPRLHLSPVYSPFAIRFETHSLYLLLGPSLPPSLPASLCWCIPGPPALTGSPIPILDQDEVPFCLILRHCRSPSSTPLLAIAG